MESKKPEEPSILPESAPDDIRQIHQPAHPMQPPHIITQPPPPPPPPAEQSRLEGHAELSTSSSLSMVPEHKTNLSQPPPNYPNYTNRMYAMRSVPPNYNPHMEPVDITMPPPMAISAYSNIVRPVQELDCCKNSKDEMHLIEKKSKEKANLEEMYAKEENLNKSLQTTFTTLLTIKSQFDNQNALSSHKEQFPMQTPERNTLSQNILSSPMTQFSNTNIPRQQLAVSSTGQDKIMYNYIPPNHQYQSSDMFRMQTGIPSNQVPMMSISADDQFQMSGMMNRPNRPMMMHPNMGSQVPMSVVSSNTNIPRPPNPSIMQPPVGQYMDNHGMGVPPNQHYMNAQMVGNTYSQVNMQHMQQPFMQHGAGQIVSTSQAQDTVQMSTMSAESQQSPPRSFLDKIRQGLH